MRAPCRLPLLLTFTGLMAACAEPLTDRFDTATIAASLHEHIAVLASDEFGGRAPATPGETLTIEYLQAQFEALGVGPGNGDSYFQTVDVTEITANADTALTLRGNNYDAELAYADDMVVFTLQQVPEVAVLDSELVFVGYGINAPERNWNDYDGLDVSGKTVVILVNDPGYATQDPELFSGNTMMYYGRWMYKFEEAARQGAAAALIVHETGPAGYGWEVVRGSNTGPQISLKDDNLNLDRAKVQGWLTQDAAEALFTGAGLDYQTLKAAAARPGFTAVPLGDIRASVSIENTLRDSTSQNVIAAIPGTARPDESIIYTAHWDHLGIKPDEPGDNIYNGAADNASGIAGLLELAKLHSTQPTPPERTVVFLAVTAEESGLLGSQWYAQHPVYPLATTVANINIDNMSTIGRARNLIVTGPGSSELEHYLADTAAHFEKTIEDETHPERGYYFRSDHFNFAKVGVPALYAESGTDSIEHGRAWGEAQSQDYIDNRYHTAADEYDPTWDMGGAAEDVLIYYDIGNRLSFETSFPNWFEGNEFKPIRDASRMGL